LSYLSATGISKRFGLTQALDKVDFSVTKGEVHGLVGENGSGKSTLMRILAGELASDEGSLTLDGKPFNPKTPLAAHKAGVALIHQELAICQHLSVAENIFLGSEIQKGGVLSRRSMNKQAKEVLTEMGYPEINPTALARTLPIAQQQVVEIARALAADAQVLLFDEPTSSLGREDVEKLFVQIERLKNDGKAIIYISHFLDEIVRIADQAHVLRDGEMVGRIDAHEESVDAIISMMVGRDVDEMYPRSERTQGDIIMEVNEADSAVFGLDASFNVHRGEVLGIAGLSGAGRTELARVIFGLDKAAGGRAQILGADGWTTPGKRWGSGVGMLSEDRKEEGLAVTLSLAENLVMPRPAKGAVINRKRQVERTDSIIEALGVKCESANQPISSLSGGNQQKIAIGRLIDAGSEILILDEPTRGIDVGSKAQIYRLIDQLALDGKAIILISSYLPEILGVSDRVAVMARGKMRPAVLIEEVDQQQLMAWCTEA
jgi:ribose transport system ATP-binding protein